MLKFKGPVTDGMAAVQSVDVMGCFVSEASRVWLGFETVTDANSELNSVCLVS